MLKAKDKKIILEKSAEYDVSRLFLFGSSINSKTPKDIDLGVEGLNPRRFFDFYSELMFLLSKPVDLLDLSKGSLFNTLVKENGIIIYEKPETKY
ncbi:MAG: hypothetical protein JXA66_06460 [Oligoflexia bacterium]|nr:hypothetical protein [Oligoflexia bacterium]